MFYTGQPIEPNFLQPWTSIYTELNDIVHQMSLIKDILSVDNTKTMEELFQMTNEDLYSFLLSKNAS
jgi:hypothetical protein